MTRNQLTLLQRAVIRRLRAAGLQALADMALDAWSNGAGLPAAQFDASAVPTELLSDLVKANGHSGAAAEDKEQPSHYEQARAMLTLPCIGGPRDGEVLAFDQLPGVSVNADAGMRVSRYVREEREGGAVWLWWEERKR